MRLARLPGVRLCPAALPASLAPALRHLKATPPEARTGSTEPAKSLSYFPPPLSPLITGHRSESGRAAPNKRSLISPAGLRRDAGVQGAGSCGEPNRAGPALGEGGTNRKGTRWGSVFPRAHRACCRGRLCGERSSPRTCVSNSGSPPGRAAGWRGRGASGGRGKSGGGTAAVCPFP